MYRLMSSLLAAITLFAACEQSNKPPQQAADLPSVTVPKQSANQFVRRGEGKKPRQGDLMLLNLVYTVPGGDTLFTSLDDALPMPMLYVDSLMHNPGGVEEALVSMRVGDSVQRPVLAGNLFANTYKQPLPAGLAAEDTLQFYIGLEEVMPESVYPTWYRFAQLPRLSTRTQEDVARIENRLQGRDVVYKKTRSGMAYEILEPGQGQLPAYGQYVKINYVARVFDNGYVFDSNVAEVAKREGIYTGDREYGPQELLIGQGQFFWGLDEALTKLKPGGVGRFYLPAELAFGKQRRGAFIEPWSIIIMEVELLDFVYP